MNDLSVRDWIDKYSSFKLLLVGVIVALIYGAWVYFAPLIFNLGW